MSSPRPQPLDTTPAELVDQPRFIRKLQPDLGQATFQSTSLGTALIAASIRRDLPRWYPVGTSAASEFESYTVGAELAHGRAASRLGLD